MSENGHEVRLARNLRIRCWPINVKFRDGKGLRFSCTALPDGRRMLSYTR